MNPRLAAFMLAIEQFLLLILLVVTIAFGDMIYTIIKRDFTLCPQDQDPDEDGNPYCNIWLGYLDMLTQILGQFGEFNITIAFMVCVIPTSNDRCTAANNPGEMAQQKRYNTNQDIKIGKDRGSIAAEVIASIMMVLFFIGT
eukprot:5882836-Ditylum_brightwellii.AAC.1